MYVGIAGPAGGGVISGLIAQQEIARRVIGAHLELVVDISSRISLTQSSSLLSRKWVEQI